MKKYWKIEGREGLWWGLERDPDGTIGLMDTDGMHWVWPGDVVIHPATFEEIHGRVKPPEIFGGETRFYYENCHPKVFAVYRSRGITPGWAVSAGGVFLKIRPTHAEAIAWAQKHAHKSGGEVSGA